METDVLPTISVITVTNRYGGIDVAYNSLRKQTYKNFEWILADELYGERKDEVAEYVQGIKLRHFKPRPKEEGHVWNLAHAYNDALNRAEGELIVILDDYIWIPPNALERWVDDYIEHGDALYTGTGHKASFPPIASPNGKITIFDNPYTEIPQGIIERDTRIDGRKELVETNHTFFELAWCAFPKKIVLEMGGFDEDTDVLYCGQDRNFALRASLLYYPVFMDKANENIGLFHQGFTPRPADWEEKHYKNNQMATMDIINGIRPIKQHYLK